MRSVLAGGSVQGWLPDNAVVLWKRMLGILGDVNQIMDPENHVMVYEELSKILDTLHKVGCSVHKSKLLVQARKSMRELNYFLGADFFYQLLYVNTHTASGVDLFTR